MDPGFKWGQVVGPCCLLFRCRIPCMREMRSDADHPPQSLPSPGQCALAVQRAPGKEDAQVHWAPPRVQARPFLSAPHFRVASEGRSTECHDSPDSRDGCVQLPLKPARNWNKVASDWKTISASVARAWKQATPTTGSGYQQPERGCRRSEEKGMFNPIQTSHSVQAWQEIRGDPPMHAS